MAQNYPIWIDISSDTDSSDKSYGIKNSSTQNIFVGSSKKNSELLVSIHIRKEIHEHTIHFKYLLDGEILREAIFEKTKENRAGKLISIKKI